MGFQVYQTEGFEEPWWFNDNWHEDVVSVYTTDSIEEASIKYAQAILQLNTLFPKYRSRVVGMAAFWQPGELSWCEPCANDEQVYHSLVIFEDNQPLSDNMVAELTALLNQYPGLNDQEI